MPRAHGGIFPPAGRSDGQKTLLMCFLHAFYDVFRHCFTQTSETNTSHHGFAPAGRNQENPSHGFVAGVSFLVLISQSEYTS